MRYRGWYSFIILLMEFRIISFERASAATAVKCGRLQINFPFEHGVWLCAQMLDHIWILEFLRGDVYYARYVFKEALDRLRLRNSFSIWQAIVSLIHQQGAPRILHPLLVSANQPFIDCSPPPWGLTCLIPLHNSSLLFLGVEMRSRNQVGLDVPLHYLKRLLFRMLLHLSAIIIKSNIL